LRYFFIYIVPFICLNVLGQTDIQLDTIIVADNKNEDLDIQKHLNQPLSNVLSRENVAFVKSYGPGSIATFSVRGLSSSHNLLIWEGLPMASSMHGNFDLSIVPVSSTSRYVLDQNGQQMAMGGALQIFNQMPDKEGIKANLTQNIGSFGQYSNCFSYQSKKNKLSSSIELINSKSKNNFSYKVDGSDAVYKMNRAEFEQTSFQKKLAFQWTKNIYIDASYFYQESHRNIAKKITQNESLSSQKDKTNRLVGSMKFDQKSLYLEAKIGFNKEQIHFTDNLNGINAQSVFESYIAKLLLKNKQPNPIEVLIINTYSAAFANEYGAIKYQNQNQIGLQKIINKNRNIFSIGLNSKTWDKKRIEILPLFEWKIFAKKSMLYTFNIQRKNRIPTLNDLYWVRDMNEELHPENGWFAEFTLNGKWKKNHHKIQSKSQIFGHLINNWIQWTPNENFLWTAKNLQRVRVIGLSQNMSWKKNIENMFVEIKSKNQIINSQFLDKSKLPNIQPYDILWYSPIVQSQLGLTLGKDLISVTYFHQFSSKTVGIVQDIPAYHLGGVEVFVQNILNKKINLVFCANNLWNRMYFITENRPMPLRNFSFQLTYKLNNK
tara:strand:- start:192 stop:2003 length:1812 start_codon:yes stop_codon:yes gene_type:complete